MAELIVGVGQERESKERKERSRNLIGVRIRMHGE